MKTTGTFRALVAILGVLAIGCEGPVGPVGPRGAQGTLGMTGDAGPSGQPGAQGTQGPAGDAGAPGVPAVAPIELEPAGLVGVVTDATRLPVAGGRVYLVPAAAVAALRASAIDLSQSPSAAATATNDEPLEDLLDAHSATYASATVGMDGVYRFTTIAVGNYFVVWVPAVGDDAHLPGGSRCRTAMLRASLVGVRIDIKVSGASTARATYVGSTPCLNCHGRHRASRSAHFNGLQVPGIRADLQDTSAWPHFDDALAAFEAGRRLYYYDCSPATSRRSQCKVSDSPPPSPALVSFEVLLGHDRTVPRGQEGEYTATLFNRRNTAEPVRYAVALSYGGALNRQQYLTRIRNSNGTSSLHVLPFQFNASGNATYPDPESWPWRDYDSGTWYDIATGSLRRPAVATAFDNNCLGCHATGFRLTGNNTDGWNGHAVAERLGEFDLDGDGRREEINLGCESCHGPGSEHLEASVRGSRIVSPSLLTPEREITSCGACHSRPVGVGGGATEAPLNAMGSMPRPGMRRADYLRLHTTRIDATSADGLFPSGSSSSNHQQLTDFVRSGMYRNGLQLMTCTSCHDPHGSDSLPNALLRSAADNSTCTGCHSREEFVMTRPHVADLTRFAHDTPALSDLRCTTCHMVRTATGGARRPALRDNSPPSPTPVQYYHGDIAGHRFDVPLRELAAAQPTATTSLCAQACHSVFLPGP